VIEPSFANFYTCKGMLGGLHMQRNCACAFSGEKGGMQVLAGLPSSSQTVESLLRILWLAVGQKN
jgi:hypothetical protein